MQTRRCSHKHFYPRPPGGGRRALLTLENGVVLFLSTPSGWRATLYKLRQIGVDVISIHALRVEGDVERHHIFGGALHFYPRPPGGGRHPREPMAPRICDFYPRPPGGGRRRAAPYIRRCAAFLSTPSGWRATVLSPSTIREYRHFYPRPPGGGRPRFDHLAEHTNRFLSTPSGWRATTAYSKDT